MESFDENLSVYFKKPDGGFEHIFCGYNNQHPDKNWYQVIVYETGSGPGIYNLDSKKEMIEKFMELVKERL